MPLSQKHYKLVIFDLDGTLTPARTSSAAAFEQRLLPGVKEKCQQLREQGVLLDVATNQRAASEGQRLRKEFLAHISWLCQQIGHVDYDVAYRYRLKPEPDMLVTLMEYHHAANDLTLMVGDSTDDQKAAIAAGVDFAWAKDFFEWEQEVQ